ncbi:MAG: 5-deoxy-glucuronate isomerase [Opitutus sp.]
MQLASSLYPRPVSGFPRGEHRILEKQTSTSRPPIGSLMDFAVVRFAAGQTISETHPDESAWVLLGGSAELKADAARGFVSRKSLFDEASTVLHLGPGTPVSITAGGEGAEFAVVRTGNDHAFEPRLFQPDDIVPEYRGAGLVQGACLRNVRLVFDQKIRPGSNLVIGEVVNYPGRWSSYPPHHHDQPEIYHYRFSHPAGYGHAEVGETVHKVRDGDTVLIPPGLDHAQVSAPGYAMYYLWLIRHLPGNPYTGFSFTEEHKWTLDPAHQGWIPVAPTTPRP